MVKDLSPYKQLIEKFSRTKILVMGDMMVDRFIRGKVSRISPEAPVPVVHVREETDLPGGAGNVMMNLSALGTKTSGCGVVGQDSIGENLIKKFEESGIQTHWIRSDSTFSSIVKTRVIAEHQQVVRFDREKEKGIAQSVQNSILKNVLRMVEDSDAVILSDYGKGFITKPLLTAVISSCRKFKKPICVDPKLEHFLLYKNVTCITPNLGEAMGGMHRISCDSRKAFQELGRDILKRLKCESVLITRGEEGMTLFQKKRIIHIPTKAMEVYDVTGAGDTVISVLTLSLACGASLIQAATLANLAAGIVVGKLGTATITSEELTDALKLL